MHPVLSWLLRWATTLSNAPFGVETALDGRWGPFRRLYVAALGSVDLPTRCRFRLLRQAIGSPPERCLDLGTGTGAYAFWLSRSPRAGVRAVDIDPRRIKAARKAAQQLGRENLSFAEGTIPAFLESLPTDWADLVLAVEVLQLLADLPSVLKDVHRVLRPGGMLVAHIPLGREPTEIEPFQFRSIDEVYGLLAEAGFGDTQVVATLGGALGQLIRLSAFASASHVATALTYPFFLSVSRFVPHKSTEGRFLLVVASKS